MIWQQLVFLEPSKCLQQSFPFLPHTQKKKQNKKTNTVKRRMGWLLCTRKGGEVGGGLLGSLPGLVACQHEIAIIEQGWQCVADSGPVLISKRVGAQIDIGPSEGLL